MLLLLISVCEVLARVSSLIQEIIYNLTCNTGRYNIDSGLTIPMTFPRKNKED